MISLEKNLYEERGRQHRVNKGYGLEDLPFFNDIKYPNEVCFYYKPNSKNAYKPIKIVQPYKIKVSHGGKGIMSIHRKSGDCLHTFQSGTAHIDKTVGGKKKKYGVKRMGKFKKVKHVGGWF